MSSSGRYQSKLFNFLQARSRDLANHLEKAGQKLRAIAQTGGHYLLVPVYAVYQATRFVGKQLSGRVEKPDNRKSFGVDRSEDRPPASDLAIQQVMQAVEIVVSAATDAEVRVNIIETIEAATPEKAEAPKTLPSKAPFPGFGKLFSGIGGKLVSWFKGSGKTATLATQSSRENLPSVKTTTGTIAGNRIAIQGIASLLETRALVLVSDRNQILDILTPAQQQQLQARIQWALENYQGEMQQLQVRSAVTAQQLPIAEPPNLLPPTRRVRQLSPGFSLPVGNLFDRSLSKLANVLQPSPLVLQPSGVSQTPPPDKIPTSQTRKRDRSKFQAALLVVDAAVARVEAIRLPQGGELATAAIEGTQSLAQTIHNVAIALVTDPDPEAVSGTPAESPSLSLRLQLLIQAAIDYFYGESGNPLPGEAIATVELSEETSKRLAQDLSATDKAQIAQKFVNVKSFSGQSEAATAQLPTNSEGKAIASNGFGVKATLKFLNRNREETVSPAKAIPQQPVARQTAAPVTPIQAIASPTPAIATDRDRTQAKSTPTQLPPPVETVDANDWIDVEIAQVEYVQHPLERSLEWLDRLMLWVEQKLSHLWQWMRQQLIG